MAQDTETQSASVQDPLQQVREEIEHSTPHLKQVGLNEEIPEDIQKRDAVKSDVPPAFVDELKDAHSIGATPDHDNAKSNAAGASNEATRSNKKTAPDGEGESRESTYRVKDLSNVDAEKRDINDPSATHFRISANPRPGGPLSRDLESETVVEGEKDSNTTAVSDDAVLLKGDSSASNAEVPITTSQLLPKLPTRGLPTFRISAHHGMRPGGPLARNLASESGDGDGTTFVEGTGLRGQAASSRGGLSNSGPRRGGGGLVRANSGVPDEKKGAASLARSGSGVPGSLARTGSGIQGNALSTGSRGGSVNTLARTGSGVPNLNGSNSLKEFNAFLDSKN